MKCQQCGFENNKDSRFCIRCGTPLIVPVKPKKGKLWPPMVIMAVMLIVGSVIFAITVSPVSKPSATPWFTIEDGTLYFDAVLYTGGSHLEIPATVSGQTVTALADECFMDCDELESVTLPDTLEYIGDRAFMGCDSLRGIKLTEKVHFVGPEAFYNCPALEAVYIPASVETMGVNAFSACFQLEHVFFAGDLKDWMELYPQYINIDTQIYRVSGPDADSYAPL